MTPTIAPTMSPPLMTAEEFLKLHGDESGVELVKGRVVRLPMPGAEHGVVCSKANYFLTGHVMEKQAGRVKCNDTLVRTVRDPATYRGADVLFISRDRLPMEQPNPKGALEVAPELVFEVRSPSDRTSDLLIKVGEYLSAGVIVVVVLDPYIDAATVYREAEEIPQRFSNGDELILPDVLPGFSTPIRAFFE